MSAPPQTTSNAVADSVGGCAPFYRWRAIGDLVGDTLVQFKAFFDSLLRGMLLFRKCLTRAFRCLTADGLTSLKSSEIV